jgi:hypothetical protein
LGQLSHAVTGYRKQSEDTPEADAEAIYKAISSVDDPVEIMDIVSQRLS